MLEKARNVDAQPKTALWKKLLLLAAAMLISFVGFEIYVRFFSLTRTWNIPREILRPGGPFSARLKPNLDHVQLKLADGPTYEISTNANGFRGPEMASIANKPIAMVSLGDSFMFGWGMTLDEHAMSRFVRWYNDAHPDHEIGNAFVASPVWNPEDYYFAYVEEVRPTKPDLVVVGIFAGNDILPPATPRILNPNDAPQQTTLSEEYKPWLYAPGWLRARMVGNPLFVSLAMRLGYETPVLDRFGGTADDQQKAWETTFFYLDALAKAVKADGGQFVVVSFPSIIQVQSSESLKRSGLDVELPDRVLGGFCREHDLPFIPVLDALLARDDKTTLYWSIDRHMTPAGQTVVLDVLEEKLTPIVDEVWRAKQRLAR